MGEYADHVNDEQANSLEELMSYESGEIDFTEAMKRGILNKEDGSIPTQVTTWGVHDVHTLLQQLMECELVLETISNRQSTNNLQQVWVSSGKICEVSKMTTQHLKNAIRYAERNNMTGNAVNSLINELSNRSDAS